MGLSLTLRRLPCLWGWQAKVQRMAVFWGYWTVLSFHLETEASTQLCVKSFDNGTVTACWLDTLVAVS